MCVRVTRYDGLAQCSPIAASVKCNYSFTLELLGNGLTPLDAFVMPDCPVFPAVTLNELNREDACLYMWRGRDFDSCTPAHAAM